MKGLNVFTTKHFQNGILYVCMYLMFSAVKKDTLTLDEQPKFQYILISKTSFQPVSHRHDYKYTCGLNN